MATHEKLNATEAPQYENPWLVFSMNSGGSATPTNEAKTNTPEVVHHGDVETLKNQFDSAFSVYETVGGKYPVDEVRKLVQERLAKFTMADSAWLKREFDRGGRVDLVIFPELGGVDTLEAARDVVATRAQELQDKLPQYGYADVEPRIAGDLVNGDVAIEDLVGYDRDMPKVAFVGRKPDIRLGGTAVKQDRNSRVSGAGVFSLSPDENLVRLLKIVHEGEHHGHSDGRTTALLRMINSAHGGGYARNFQMPPIDGRVLESGVDTGAYQVYVGWSNASDIKHNNIGAVE
ncbi:hypothetical protein FWF74_01455 [Candidatus Saccharibacteria bacterium]|nr:hypothetical protein [Candidatus Saccharibacteria bacterium]MCL1963115.1 hypothetical protein [Candidatus Saccharibacteria bacterium]